MQPVERVRHTIILEDEHGLLELQRKNEPYVTEKGLKMCEKENFELENKNDKIDLEN